MSQVERFYSEKRDFLRLQIDTPVQIFVRSENLDLSGTCLDLSGNGMNIELEKPLPVGCELDVAIKSPSGDGTMLRAEVVVARVNSGPGNLCNLGLKILNMLD